jgi:hypothetical protein
MTVSLGVLVVADAVRIEAVVEAPWFDGSPPWPWPIAALPPFQHFRIHGDMTLEETGSLVAALADPLEMAPGLSAQDALRQLAELEYFGLSGGLAVSASGRFVVRPGCCSGLEEWREWWAIRDRQSPWMGHDPTPWCQFLGDGLVRFWSGGGYTHDEIEPHVDLSTEGVAESLENVHADLRAVLGRLADWLGMFGCAEAETMLTKFDRSFAISTTRPAYLDAE